MPFFPKNSSSSFIIKSRTISNLVWIKIRFSGRMFPGRFSSRTVYFLALERVFFQGKIVIGTFLWWIFSYVELVKSGFIFPSRYIYEFVFKRSIDIIVTTEKNFYSDFDLIRRDLLSVTFRNTEAVVQRCC